MNESSDSVDDTPRTVSWNTIVLALCLVLVMHVEWKLYRFEKQYSITVTELITSLRVLREELDELKKNQVTKASDDIASLVETEVESSRLRDGLYTLSTEVMLRKGRGGVLKKQRVTIYHIKTKLSLSSPSQSINMGMATSGLLSVPYFYIDYDSDNVVDLDMMEEFVYYLPMGRMMAKATDYGNSQRSYSAFLRDFEKSRYIAIEDIEAQGGQIAQTVWSFIQEKSSDMAGWIGKKTGAITSPSSTEGARF